MSPLIGHILGLPVEEVLIPLSGLSLGVISASLMVGARRLRGRLRRARSPRDRH